MNLFPHLAVKAVAAPTPTPLPYKGSGEVGRWGTATYGPHLPTCPHYTFEGGETRR